MSKNDTGIDSTLGQECRASNTMMKLAAAYPVKARIGTGLKRVA